MNNTVILENPTHRRIKLAIIVLLVFTAIIVVAVFTLRAANTRNLNGDVREVTGTVSDIIYDNIAQIVFDDGSSYNANTCISFYDFDLNQLVGKNVALYVPDNQFGNGIPIILGIVVENETLIDYQETITAVRADNTTGMIVCSILAGITGMIALALFVWRLYIPVTKEFSLAEKYSEYSMQRQPHCPEHKVLVIYLIAGLATIMALTLVYTIVVSIVKSDLVGMIFGLAIAVIIMIYGVAIAPLNIWLAKKEIEFYAANFPFDFTDVSHIRMRKSFKQQLQQMVESERKLYPHRYGDGGNGYEIDFTPHGVDFFATFDDEIENNSAVPTAENVFGLDENKKQPCFTLSYERLNFEAVAIYRKYDHPITVVVKSRLTQDCDLPKEMLNDVHIILDSNLLETLRTFSVEVENLQYLLDNKENLMKENCPKQRNRQY